MASTEIGLCYTRSFWPSQVQFPILCIYGINLTLNQTWRLYVCMHEDLNPYVTLEGLIKNKCESNRKHQLYVKHTNSDPTAPHWPCFIDFTILTCIDHHSIQGNCVHDELLSMMNSINDVTVVCKGTDQPLSIGTVFLITLLSVILSVHNVKYAYTYIYTL